MNTSRFFDIMASIVVVALVTTLVLPGRQTGAVISSGSQGFASVLRAAQGR
jgi:hypothetical protein